MPCLKGDTNGGGAVGDADMPDGASVGVESSVVAVSVVVPACVFAATSCFREGGGGDVPGAPTIHPVHVSQDIRIVQTRTEAAKQGREKTALPHLAPQ